MDELDEMICITWIAGMTIVLLLAAAVHISEYERAEFKDDYGLGSVVTTTAEYEYMTNDSFSGVVVSGEGWDEPSLTVRNRNGDERRIATKFLKPME